MDTAYTQLLPPARLPDQNERPALSDAAMPQACPCGKPADYAAWLSAGTALDQVQRLIQPCPEGLLAAHPVSTAVGNVRNEGPELIRAV